MSIDVAHYRTMDALYGTVETSMQTRQEIAMLRSDQVRLRRASLTSPALILLITLLGVIPALYEYIPDDSQKNIWIHFLTGIIIIFLVVVIWQWVDAAKELKEIEGMMPADADHPLEQRPEFLLFVISSYGTRLSIAREILKSNPEPAVEAKFRQIHDYWVSSLEGLGRHIEKLRAKERIDAASYEQMRQWLDSAMASNLSQSQ